MAFVENRAVFFSDLGINGVLGNGEIIRVIFDRASDSFDFKSEGLEITALIDSSDAESLNRDDSITINNNVYTISQILPEDDGMLTKLVLSE